MKAKRSQLPKIFVFTYLHTALHYIALHCIVLHYIALHWIAFIDIKFPCLIGIVEIEGVGSVRTVLESSKNAEICVVLKNSQIGDSAIVRIRTLRTGNALRM